MENDISTQKINMALRMCDILGLEDFTTACSVLQSYKWNIEKAMNEIINKDSINKIKEQQNLQTGLNTEDPYNIDQNQIDDMDFEYEYAAEEFDHKKRIFQQQYASLVPLNKTTSENRSNVEVKLSYQRQLIQQNKRNRLNYQKHLLAQSQVIAQRILSSSVQRNKFQQSSEKNRKNRSFIAFLHQQYKTRINFTFGTFFLNLIRSHLDSKYLLVYIHSSEKKHKKLVEMLLTQAQIANFINKKCISYGMFDNSDDYESLQKYTSLKNIPTFLLFQYNKQQKKQKLIDEYSIIQKKDNENFMQWLALSMGITLKKKDKLKQQQKNKQNLQNQQKLQKLMISDIVAQQNTQYQQLQKIYFLKRQLSKQRKQNKLQWQNSIQIQKQSFPTELQYQINSCKQIKFRMPISGKSITRIFHNNDKIQLMFSYIHCFCRDQFEDPYGDFDLTQTFPFLSLKELRNSTLNEIFPESNHQNLIVKEI